MNTEYGIVIPARMASERLPGKPLLDIGGKPLIQRVWERARCSRAADVIIATDAAEIREAAGSFGALCLMTRPDHVSGGDRIAECVGRLDWPADRIVVNLQGDEPLMPAECLDQVAELLAEDQEADAASLFQRIDDPEEIRNPNAVKVVVDGQGRALYFSRAVVPAVRSRPSIEAAVKAGRTWKRHVGLYAYRAGALLRFTMLEPTPLERAERLEQLRILESGGQIAMAEAVRPVPAGVDTAEDLERVRREF